MASILFLMRSPLDGQDNLTSKFRGQMAAAEALGHQAYFIGWNGQGMWLCRGGERTLLKRCALARMPGYAVTALYVDLMAALKRALDIRPFDLIYMRFMPVFSNAPDALGRHKARGGKLIVEHPTYPFENGKVTSLIRRPVFAYNAWVFRRIEPMIDLYTLIGDPCDGTLGGRPAMNILNGVDVDGLPMHAPRGERDIGLLALASMSNWQGYDRLIEALARYHGKETVTVHMVGGEGDGSLAQWKRLVREKGLEDRVLFYGELHGGALDGVAAQCDVGVGGLGLYRKKQYVSMTLKLREYMARGLPFVYAVEDPSIPKEPRFCLKLANDDTPLDLEPIVAFAMRAKADAQAPALMRAYARERMSWQGVLKEAFGKVGIACRAR
ncbi:MAG: glycosyltransferase [Clostridiales bacterium]|nr:glycosyltransferase [Clostridiales bacterium]MDO4350514.1 glycosyltransferase [Eubacteriales bacterium]MDY4008559.1 glycosyltransferase [Candidatus Limiplasma sp.]